MWLINVEILQIHKERIRTGAFPHHPPLPSESPRTLFLPFISHAGYTEVSIAVSLYAKKVRTNVDRQESNVNDEETVLQGRHLLKGSTAVCYTVNDLNRT